MNIKGLLNDLTEEQERAVCHKTGPALVVAGAGTGKTTIITRRIVWLINKGHAKPDEILALTFTEKAASEMLSRIDDLSDYVYGGLSVSTFHSFGAEIISEFSYELGLAADVRVLSEAELVLFLTDNIFKFELNHYQNLGDPTALVRELAGVFSRAKDEAVLPEEWIKKAKKNLSKNLSKAEREEAEKDLEIALAYKTYSTLLHENGYIDYGDQILLVLRLLEKPSIGAKIKSRFKYALIDEFQDTNFAQSKLIKQIFGSNGNVMVVGDDDQSIYRFRGASISNILNFKKEYKGVKTYVLNKNFRSSQEILDLSHKFIKNNDPNRLESKYGINKQLSSALGSKASPELNFFDDETKEASFVVKKIKDGIKNGDSFSDYAILVRANSHAEEFVLALKKNKIPYVFSGASGLYQKLEVKNLISLVAILSDPSDNLALFHLAASEIYKVNMEHLAKASAFSRRKNINLSDAFEKPEVFCGEIDLSEETFGKMKKITHDVSSLREESRSMSAGEIINLFLKKSGYYKKLTTEARDGSVEAYTKITNIAAFFDRIIHFQRSYRDHSLEKFARYLEVMLVIGADTGDKLANENLNAVSVLSMHRAKGLEFKNVFIVSLSDSHMPGSNRKRGLELPGYLVRGEIEKSKDANTEEERRLLYVAMTRAKEGLFLSAALDYGTKKTHKASRFLAEIFGKDKIEYRFLKTDLAERIKGFERVGNLYNVFLEPIAQTEKIVLSRAAIDDYLTCPFKYQLIHVTPIRIMTDAKIAYGNAIHNTISEYFKLKKAKKEVDFKDVLKLFDVFWDESGFLSKEHEKRRYEQGRMALKSFFKKAEDSALPVYVEKEFKVSLGNNIVKGRYDAIYESQKKIEIVDFKTSIVKNQEKADKRTKESSQLAMYAFSWFENTGSLPDALKLYFVDTGIIGSFSPTEKTIEKTREKISKACQGIRERKYEATPSLGACEYCPFVFYCPVAVRRKSLE